MSNPYDEIVTEYEELQEVWNQLDALNSDVFHIEGSYTGIIIEIDKLNDLKYCVKALKDILGSWKYKVSSIYTLSNKNACVNWSEINAKISICISFTTPIKKFPKSLMKNGCSFKEVTTSAYYNKSHTSIEFVCENKKK